MIPNHGQMRSPSQAGALVGAGSKYSLGNFVLLRRREGSSTSAPTLLEHLDSVISEVHHVYFSRTVNRYTPRFVKLPVAGAEAAPFSQEIAGRIELLNAMVVFVRHVDIS